MTSISAVTVDEISELVTESIFDNPLYNQLNDEFLLCPMFCLHAFSCIILTRAPTTPWVPRDIPGIPWCGPFNSMIFSEKMIGVAKRRNCIVGEIGYRSSAVSVRIAVLSKRHQTRNSGGHFCSLYRSIS
jgi:hypothetical protein